MNHLIKEYKYWVSSSTGDNDIINKYKLYNSYNDIDEQKIIKLINKYKELFNNSVSISDIKKIAKQDINNELYLLLELDSFFKTLKVKQKLDSNINDEYFDEYIADLPKLFMKIKNDFSEYSLKSKFDKLDQLKKTKEDDYKLSKNIFDNEIDALNIEFLKMLEWLKSNKQRVLITLDGRDSAGKGSFIKLIENNMPEKIVSHTWFDIPTEYEQKNWFNRYYKALPKPGQLKFYDRSWYNRAVNDPVNGYCTEKQYEKFMTDVIPFENKLIDEGIIYIKLWFSIDKETQEFRFNSRQVHPFKYWKYSKNDAKAIENYEKFTYYKEQMFKKTSTKKSPWIIADMNDNQLGQINVIKYILTKIPYNNKNEYIIKPSIAKIYTA